MISLCTVIAAWLECFPEKSTWCRNEVPRGKVQRTLRFEQSNGLDTALYKSIPFYLFDRISLKL